MPCKKIMCKQEDTVDSCINQRRIALQDRRPPCCLSSLHMIDSRWQALLLHIAQANMQRSISRRAAQVAPGAPNQQAPFCHIHAADRERAGEPNDMRTGKRELLALGDLQGVRAHVAHGAGQPGRLWVRDAVLHPMQAPHHIAGTHTCNYGRA